MCGESVRSIRARISILLLFHLQFVFLFTKSLERQRYMHTRILRKTNLTLERTGGATSEAIRAFQRGEHLDDATSSSKKKDSLTHELVFEMQGLSDVDRVDFSEKSPFELLLTGKKELILLDMVCLCVGVT